MRANRFAVNSVLFMALALVATSCGGGGVDAVGAFEKKLTWGTCKGDDAPKDPFECASLTVPADYRKTEGDSLEIALIRLPASKGKAKGIILTNPGGPGGSGFGFVQDGGGELVTSLGLEEFDVVGFDPRGVERSGGVRCLTDKQLDDVLYVDRTPDTPAEIELDKKSDSYDDACTDKYGSGLKNFSTEFTARDMDLIRASMGFEQMHYLGISYGTYLGGVYASLFPNRVASMVLDGAFDPQGDTPEQEYTTQAEGFEKAFNNWVKWCEEFEEKCPFHSDDVKRDWLGLAAKLDKASLISGKRDVNHNVMDRATRVSLYSESMWADLGRALSSAQDGDGTALLNLADRANGRAEDGTYSTQKASSSVIRCASGIGLQEPKDPKALLKKLQTVAPWYARGFEESDFSDGGCEDGFGTPKLAEVKYSGTAPIVVVGGKNDPATPFRWSEEMTKNMGGAARLVTFTGEGHSQILVARCVDKIAGAVFTKGVLPKKGAVCTPDVPIAKPTWWESTVSVSGKTLDASTMNDYFGINRLDAYAEYYAVPGSVANVFGTISTSLLSQRLRYSKGEETDPVKAPQWFYDSKDAQKSVWVFISSADELKENKMVVPAGIVPQGHLAVAVYYFP